MVPLAAESAAPQLTPSLPAPRTSVLAAPRPQRRMPVAEVILFLLGWLLVVGAALLLVSRYDAVNRMTDSNARARQELARLGMENQALQQRVDELSSLDRIAKLATTRLHMVAPGKMAVAKVDSSLLAQRPAPSLAALTPPQPAPESGFWHQVAAWWQNIRGDRGVAQGK